MHFGLKMSDNYKFFNPNICHICKITDNGNFIICDQCYLITYCSKDHREEDYPFHMEICAAVSKLLKKGFKWNSVSQEEWLQSRENLIRLVKLKLSRDLMTHEMQIIRFAKSCFVCHQQRNVQTCKMCYSANYCVNHAEVFKCLHNSRCKELLLCLSLDMELIHGFEFKLKFTRFPNCDKPSDDMDTFIKHYVQRTHISRELEDWHFPEYFYSDYTSGPLTLYYGMKDANLEIPDLCCVIHVIDATYLDRKYLPAWELILHLISKLKEIKIILIGSELHNECNNIEVCSRCNNISYDQYLNFESYCMSYHNYITSKLYKRPDLIIGFEADLSDVKTWRESILKLQDQGCPLLLTTKSKRRADMNINSIQQVLGISLKPLIHRVNNFASRRPWRDFETDYVFYRNFYITIYQNLREN